MRIIYIVPKCPKCESIRTGRYVEYRGLDPDGYQASFLRKGEIIMPSYTAHSNNLFCVDCDFEWSGSFTKKLISGKELKKIKEEIGISDELIEELEDHIVDSVLKYKEAHKPKILKMIGKFSTSMLKKATIEPFKDILPKRVIVDDDFDAMLEEVMQEDVNESATEDSVDNINEERIKD